MMVPLKYFGNFWRTLEVPLTNCEINLILTWSANCVIVSTDVANQGATFSITETKIHVVVVTLSTQDNAKVFQQLKSGFKRTINSNKYLKTKIIETKWKLNHLVQTSFQGIDRLFVLSFKNDAQRTSNKRYYLRKGRSKRLQCYN